MLSILLMSLLTTRAKITPQGGPHLCDKREQVLFSCALQNASVVSLCASADVAANGGTVQFRQGSRVRAEQKFPAPANDWWHVFFFQRSPAKVTWKGHGNAYELSAQGLKTTTDEGEGDSSFMACTRPVTDNLQQLATLLPNAED